MTKPTADQEAPKASPGMPERKAPAARGRRLTISGRAFARGEREARSPKALAVSVLLHLVVAVIVVQILTFGHGLTGFLDFGKDAKKEERVTYVATRPPPTPEP